MVRLPKIKITKAKSVVIVIITTIETIELCTKTPTVKDTNAPKPNCIAPINADALPAFLAKGARVSPAVFGLEIPKQDKNKNNITIVPYKPKTLFIDRIRNNITITDCEIKAPKIICSLLNRRNSKEFN